jgi:hypothetical protein
MLFGLILAGMERGATILDAGSALGGPSHYLAGTYGCRVIGADLSQSFVAVAHPARATNRFERPGQLPDRFGDAVVNGKQFTLHCSGSRLAPRER